MGVKEPQPWSPPTIRPDYKAEAVFNWSDMSRVGRVIFVFAHSLWVVPVGSIVIFGVCLIAWYAVSLVGSLIRELIRWDFSDFSSEWHANTPDLLRRRESDVLQCEDQRFGISV